VLIRSMSKRLRNVPASFDEPVPGETGADGLDGESDDPEPRSP